MAKWFTSSSAADLNNEDEAILNDEWVKLPIKRVIWDLNGDLDETSDNIVIPVDGIYNLDIQLRVKDCVNVDFVEVAIWKVGDPDDDYWFILDKGSIQPVQTEVHLNCSTQFDFYKDEQYYVAVKLHSDGGGTPTATIEGSDDYTAWGFSLEDNL